MSQEKLATFAAAIITNYDVPLHPVEGWKWKVFATNIAVNYELCRINQWAWMEIKWEKSNRVKRESRCEWILWGVTNREVFTRTVYKCICINFNASSRSWNSFRWHSSVRRHNERNAERDRTLIWDFLAIPDSIRWRIDAWVIRKFYVSIAVHWLHTFHFTSKPRVAISDVARLRFATEIST